jgi:PAS domain S-box-containing protein
VSLILNITPEELQKITSFYILLDDKRKIKLCSKALLKLCPDLSNIEELSEAFSCDPLNQKGLKELEGNDFIFIEHKASGLKFRGVSFVLCADKLTMFALSPLVKNIVELTSRGFSISDFAMHDTLIDSLLLMQAHENTVKQSKTYATALRQQLELEFYKRAVDESSMFVRTNTKGVITTVNDTFCKLSGYPKEELLGKTLKVISSGKHDQEFHRKLWETLLAGKVYRGEICNRTKKGTLFWVDTTIMPFADESGMVESYAAIQIDISEKKFAMEQLERVSKAKAEFLANMSHEIRTPMNGIIGMMSLINSSESLEEVKEYGKTIKSSCDLLLRLVNDILDLSKIEAGKIAIELNMFDVRSVIETLLDLYRESADKKGILLNSDIAFNVPFSVEGDALRIQQVLSNLVSNAIKFTEKGEVRLGVHSEETGSDSCKLIFTVMDTGRGMNSEVVGKLFQRFEQGDSTTTKKFGGTGLGLAISKRLSQLMGGDLWVESIEGKGTIFKCEVPMKFENKRTQPDSQAPTLSGGVLAEPTPKNPVFFNQRGEHPRILIAEDNPVNQFVLEKMLSKLGCESHCAANGLEAITAAQSFNYDLILMDCFMPELDGYEAALKIKNNPGPCQNTPIIAVTANALRGEAEKCASFGMSGYLSKPIVLKTLSQELGKYFQAR